MNVFSTTKVLEKRTVYNAFDPVRIEYSVRFLLDGEVVPEGAEVTTLDVFGWTETLPPLTEPETASETASDAVLPPVDDTPAQEA